MVSIKLARYGRGGAGAGEETSKDRGGGKVRKRYQEVYKGIKQRGGESMDWTTRSIQGTKTEGGKDQGVEKGCNAARGKKLLDSNGEMSDRGREVARKRRLQITNICWRLDDLTEAVRGGNMDSNETSKVNVREGAESLAQNVVEYVEHRERGQR